MKTLHTLILSLSISCLLGANPYPTYIMQYKDVAIQEMQRSGIPASIIMAQAILESSWGKGALAQAANNHFGIKCKKEWEGPSYPLFDDDYDKEGNLVESCFRSYADVLSSYRDHTNFLMERSRYGQLFDFPSWDYKSWAMGLQTCGYATDPEYGQKLILRIEKYSLDKLDSQTGILEAPYFEIPYQEPAKKSLFFERDFGLIEIPTESKKPGEPLEAPHYTIDTRLLAKP
ncbi:MAG: hypothetical protein HKN16_10545 [Saprospiraceae bacterium]|nr:hypothetical protein [Saprospiraceae bacterium]